MNTFVTGGSRGVGRAIVLKMIAEGYGCAFTYVKDEKAAEETRSRAKKIKGDAHIEAIKLDVVDPAQVEAAVEEALDRFDSIGAVINNAGVVRNNAAVLMSDEEWNTVLATNLSGPFFIIRAFLMHFLSNKFGRIINISSLAQDGASGQINYAASKAGLIGLTRTLAREYGEKGITCNTVTVGLVETDMVKDHLADKLKEIWYQYCPIKRIGNADEIAAMVYYLTTKDAGFINGENIRISGGLTYVP